MLKCSIFVATNSGTSVYRKTYVSYYVTAISDTY